jgi:hypothetical protein
MNTNCTSRRRIVWLLCTAIGVSVASQSAPAQQQQSGKIIGARLKTPQPFNFVRIPPAQKTAVTEMMQKLYDIVRRDTMFYEPVAFDVQPSPRIDIPPRPGYAPVEYDSPFFMFAYGPDTPATQPGWRTTTRAFKVHGNGLGHLWRSTDKWEEDEQGQMYFEPVRLADVKGYPNYGKGLVVVTRSERPLYIPAPLERAMKFVIAQNKKGIEDMKDPMQQPIVARTKACVDKLEKELAAMSPADRAGPTYFSMTRVPGRDRACDPFSSASDKNAKRIIIENPDFYDTKRPPSAIQVVFLDFNGFNARLPDQKAQVDRIANQLDWAALAALTAKP